jgi:hypothetical protein
VHRNGTGCTTATIALGIPHASSTRSLRRESSSGFGGVGNSLCTGKLTMNGKNEVQLLPSRPQPTLTPLNWFSDETLLG